MTRAARDLIELLDHLDQAAATIRRHGPAILDRAAIPSGRDGYPTRASGAQATSAPQVRHECTVAWDATQGLYRARCEQCGLVGPVWPTEAGAIESGREHEDSQGSVLDYGDPTGEAAVARSEPDPVRALAKRTLRDLGHVVHTATAVANALAAEAGQGATLNDPTDWCAHHLRFGIHEPRRPPINGRPAGDLCRPCADFQRVNGQLPPKVIIEKRARGERITEADVARALSSKAG